MKVVTEQPESKRVRSRPPAVLDEHYYRNTEAFLKDSPEHYEKYDRKGPEILWVSGRLTRRVFHPETSSRRVCRRRRT